MDACGGRAYTCSSDLQMEAMLSIGAAQALEIILPFLQSSATAVSQAESVAAGEGGPEPRPLLCRGPGPLLLCITAKRKALK